MAIVFKTRTGAVSKKPTPSAAGAPLTQRYLNVAEAARYLGVSKSLLDKLRSKGRGPLYSKLGTRILYERLHLDAWVAENVRRPAVDGTSK
jgi:excisionase family DNA binding protein